MQAIEAIRFQVEEVGKHVKGSKKRYCWQIGLKDKHHTIVLDFSFISSKVKITVDRKILLQNQLPSNVSFQYPFTLDGFALNIIQQGESFQLRINNKVFSHLYIQKKTNSEFKKYEEEVKDIKVDFNQNNNQKKISLNIGAFGGAGMKKKKEINQSQGWNAMAGTTSFPNYFGDGVNQEKKQQFFPTASQVVPSQDLFNFAEEKVQKSQNLLQQPSVVKSKPNPPPENIFEFDMGSQKTTSTTSVPQSHQPQSEDLFNSFNLGSQKNNAEIDFFAEETKKSELIQTKNNSSDNNFFANTTTPSSKIDFNFAASSINMSGFATGYGVEQKTKTNPNQFATSSNNVADLSFDMFANAPTAKPLESSMNFSKKPANSQESSLLTQLDNLNLNSPAYNTNTNTNNNTNINPNMYASNSPSFLNTTPVNNIPVINQQNIDLNDFSTMQLLFQSNSLGVNPANNFPQSFATNSQKPIQNIAFTQDLTLNQLNQPQNTFNQPQNNLTGLNLNLNQPMNNSKKSQLSSFDFASSKPAGQFNTMSGGLGMSSGINENKFSTIQFNPNQSLDMQFNFLQTKPAKVNQNSSNDLI